MLPSLSTGLRVLFQRTSSLTSAGIAAASSTRSLDIIFARMHTVAAPAGLERFLVTGANGQIGLELVSFLRARVGAENVVATDIKTVDEKVATGPFELCDVQDKQQLTRLIGDHHISYIVHLASVLSAVGEQNPNLALRVNTLGIQNVLDLAAQRRLRVYAPSTIAVFGPDTPRLATPDVTVMRPSTMYGITKVHQELLGQYYRDRFAVDYRSLRYPGVVSACGPPGGGTTDYAVHIFHAALRTRHYTSFLAADTALPMMYMPDCLDATWRLMTAPRSCLSQATYNVTAMTFTPAELAAAIQHFLPDFTISYAPDFRDAIARTWPASIDDSVARRDWGWRPRYDLLAMARHMLTVLQPGLELPQPHQATHRLTHCDPAAGLAVATAG